MSQRKKLLTNTLWLYSLQGLNYVLPMLVLPYLIRVLGVGNYGLIAVAQAFAQYFTIFTDYGFNLSATKRIAIANGEDGDMVRRTFWGVLLIKCVLLLAGFALLLAITSVVQSNWKGAALPLPGELALLLREGWHLFLSTAAVTLYTNTNVFLVGMLGGVAQAGYFSAAEKIIRAAQGLLIPITQVLFPHVNTLVKQSRAVAVRFIRRSLFTIALPTLVGSLLILLCAPLLAHLAFGFANSSTNSTLRWISFIPFLVAVSNILGIQTMVAFGYERAFSRILITAGVFNITFAWFLIRWMGAPGAGAAVLATEAFITVTMLWYLRRIGIHLFWSRDGSDLSANVAR